MENNITSVGIHFIGNGLCFRRIGIALCKLRLHLDLPSPDMGRISHTANIAILELVIQKALHRTHIPHLIRPGRHACNIAYQKR